MWLWLWLLAGGVDGSKAQTMSLSKSVFVSRLFTRVGRDLSSQPASPAMALSYSNTGPQAIITAA